MVCMRFDVVDVVDVQICGTFDALTLTRKINCILLGIGPQAILLANFVVVFIPGMNDTYEYTNRDRVWSQCLFYNAKKQKERRN